MALHLKRKHKGDEGNMMSSKGSADSVEVTMGFPSGDTDGFSQKVSTLRWQHVTGTTSGC